MLQQTQVNRVAELYYPQFLKQFPSIEALAKAHLDEVLAAWSGLGYYSRARNLHKSAKMIYDGFSPKSVREFKELYGVGEYTASAVCSFALNLVVPVVDTNIARVLRRFFAIENATPKIIWQYAQDFLNHAFARDHNLALMDLGSLICTPTNPKCSNCPLFGSCQGSNNVMFYTKSLKKEYESMELFYGVWIKNDQIALVRAEGSMYKEMLTLPCVDPNEEDFIGSFKHSYTKYRLNVKLYQIDTLAKDDIVWVFMDEVCFVPIASITKKAILLINKSTRKYQ